MLIKGEPGAQLSADWKRAITMPVATGTLPYGHAAKGGVGGQGKIWKKP